MPSHRFALGEKVIYMRTRFPNLFSGALCEISALLPVQRRQPEYEVRHADLGSSVVVSEGELCPRPRRDDMT